MRLLRFAAVPAFVCAMQASAAGQVVTLSFESALSRAREQAPSVLVARARIDEVRGRLVGARARYRENPIIDGSVGPRWAEAGTLADFDFGVSQVLETGGQRAARIASAEAAISRETATADDAARVAVGEVALIFLQALHAQERIALLTSAETTARDVVSVADRRYTAGDIAVLDLNVARSALARARAGRLAADADRAVWVGELQRVLGYPRGTVINIQGLLPRDRDLDVARLLAAVDNRADLRAIRAEIAEAEAEVRLAKAIGRPDVGVGARLKNEEGHRAFVGELSVTVPLFNRGQELQATGLARVSRLRIELEHLKALAIAEVETMYAAYLIRRTAVQAFEQDALPALDENETLAQRSFEVGQISLPELLLIRRELVEARLDYLDRLREAAEAAVVQESVAGVLR